MSATASAAVRPPGVANTPVGRQSRRASCRSGVADAAKPAVAFAGAVVTLGALISLLVPNIPAEGHAPTPVEYVGLTEEEIEQEERISEAPA